MISVKINTNSLASLAKKVESVALNAQNNVIRIVANSMLPIIRDRIHDEGKAADESKIGDYSTKPIYVSNNIGFGTLDGTGKTGRKVFSNGEAHKSKYFAGGYEQFKTEIGRNKLGSVNLSLSGQLASQFTLIATNKGWGLGWNDTEKFTRAFALEKKYAKKIWALTKEELQIANEIAQNEFKNAFSEKTN